MAAGRSLKTLVGRRRRMDEDGEDDEGPVMVEDSQSEGSVLSDVDGEEDASSFGDAQSTAGANGPSAPAEEEVSGNGTKPAKGRKNRSRAGKKQAQAESSAGSAEKQSMFKAAADTEAMMKGLNISDQKEDAVDFEAMGESSATLSNGQAQAASAANGRVQRPAERQRREHEDYKKKRDSDPAFIPNRGNFFMHDTRGAPGGQGPAPMRGAFGRGRGRGGPSQTGPPFSHASQAPRPNDGSQMAWKHDLHEAINEEPPKTSGPRITAYGRDQEESARIFAKPVQPAQKQVAPPPISFNKDALVGKTGVRVLLPGMKTPSSPVELTIKRYTRLPDHRPPLRRDKPVRVFISGLGPKYIFPAVERSFIFIPRQMRPGQRGFHGNSYQRSVGGHGYSSRRTSMYGGSMYSASIAHSRRSSIARDNTFSPVSFASGFPGQARPVVRLPHNGHFFSNATSPAGPLSGQHTPVGQIMHTYPLPQKPTFTGTPTATVHQPRPQKAISVTGIESPAALQQARPPSEDQQPFHGQLPAHLHEQQAYAHQPQPAPYYPQQGFQYPQQAPQAGTPLSGIPEHAIHAQAFQPPGMFYPQYPPQQGYYYQPPPMPMYMPQQGYNMPPPQQAAPPPQPSAEPRSESQQASQSGMVAHESNGMVFYMPAAEAQQQSTQEHYQPAESFVPSYAMAGLPPPTPAPDTSYYYPMDMSQSMYYPPQQQQQQQ